MTQPRLLAMVALIGLGLSASGAAAAQNAESGQAKSKAVSTASGKLDRSGKKQVGKASFYARKFTGRKMADGTRMNPRDGLTREEGIARVEVAPIAVPLPDGGVKPGAGGK